MTLRLINRSRRCLQFPFLLISALVAGILINPGMATAKDVTLSHTGMTLNANLELADGKTIGDGIILITHGTFAHNKMEIVATLQTLFKERGLSTLAINLSLGVDNRKGVYDCAVPFNHRHSDASQEIAAWVGWLENQGVNNILLVGHSRGGNQTAMYLVEHDNERIRGAVLIAPATWDYDKASQSYEKSNKVPLAGRLDDMKKLIAANKGSEMIQNVALLYCPDATVTPDTFVSYYEDHPLKDTPQALKQVTEPVMVIAGSDDTVVADLPEKMAKISSPGIRFEVIDDAGHFFRDLYAEDIADLTEDFMANLP